MTIQIINGDCLEVMRSMPENSVDAVVTDPPYGMSFMGKDWDYGIPGKTFWIEVLRVAKSGCHLLAFGGTRTYHRLTCAIEDAGWEIRDCVFWTYGSGFPKSHNLKGDWGGWGTALKPAVEPVVLARKSLDGTVAENVQKWGCGALNIDRCRIGTTGARNNGNSRGTIGSNSIGVYGKAIKMDYNKGRWPANLIHDGSQMVLDLFPSQDGIVGAHREGGDKSIFSGGGHRQTIKQRIVGGIKDSGSAARFFYCAKASRKEREMGCESLTIKQTVGGGGMNNTPDDVCGKYGSIKAPSRNHHPTVKPVALMRYLCRLVTPPGGTVLDPFGGSGSTGIAAKMEGFNFIGIEKEADYCAIAEKRIAAVLV